MIRLEINKIFCVSLALLFCVSLALPLIGHAASLGLAVDNTLFDIALLPGESHQDSFEVLNKSDSSALPISISLTLWDTKNDQGDIEFVENTAELNATKWFSFASGTEAILKPGEERKIYFKIEPPKTTPPGSYFIMARMNPALPAIYFNEGETRQVPQIGVLFFIKISPLALDAALPSYQGSVKSVEIVSKSNQVRSLKDLMINKANAGFLDEAVQKIILGVSNDGIYHFKSSGYVEIKNWYGAKIAAIDLPEKYVLPGRIRKIEVSTLPLAGDFTGFWAKLWNAAYATIRDNTYFGPYTAVIHLNIPERGPSETSVSFWVVPWKFWLPVLIILVGAVMIIIRLRKRLKLAFAALIGRA